MASTGGEPVSNGVNGARHRHFAYEDVSFDPALKPKSYEIQGTPANSRILFTDVKILDSTGREPYEGDVYIEGERIKYVGNVPNKDSLLKDGSVRVIQGRGRTLMSGLGDAHTHFSWNNGDLAKLGELGVEEHTLVTAQAAKTYLDSGYTMCFGAASAKDRLDCVIRDAINRGDIPGPRYLANAKEMAVPDGELIPGITAYAKGPLEMREVIRRHIDIGADQIKLSMSGEEITETRSAQDCYFTDEETAACVDEAHRAGVRLCAHARARDSVKMCVNHGVDVIYHASWIDDEGMDMLEKNKSRHIVAPGINWLVATLYEAASFGYPPEKAESVGYKKELEVAIKGLREMHKRGICVLPGGDYGFAWTPHGTYARDLEHFVKLLGFTPMEAVVAATAGVAKLFMREAELGKLLPGYYADCILIDGNPLADIRILQDHSKLNIIVINGRIHKAAHSDFSSTDTLPAMAPRLVNFISYSVDDGTNRTFVGHHDRDENIVTPLAFASGTPASSLYEIIEAGYEGLIEAGAPVPLGSVKILPPLAGRDVLAIGKNYSEHAKEFNASGYDASDRVDMPSHPVIFTKRVTSIIAHEEEILPHTGFTDTLDYEGEIGVIIGKSGFRITEQDADQYIWGFTIINDVTARERQRDHKQFYIGKSGDTFCPMGPIAVPKEALPKVLTVQTKVNGELRQEGNLNDLIFNIPNLIATISDAQTIQPGDVIATGTPAGVGFGLNPPQFLKPGDLVEISVTGLGTLRNKVAGYRATNAVEARVTKLSVIPTRNLERTLGGVGLITLPSGKKLHVQVKGSEPLQNPIVFIHGLGGSSSYFLPFVSRWKNSTFILPDLEGFGLSPTSATSVVTIDSYVEDIAQLFEYYKIEHASIISHSMGGAIGLKFAHKYPGKVDTLVMLGPPITPFPAPGVDGLKKRAAAVRAGGMREVAHTVAEAGTSEKTKAENPLGYTGVVMTLLASDPEGYAKGCSALMGLNEPLTLDGLPNPVLVLTGEEDKISTPEFVTKWVEGNKKAKVVILKGVGHWHLFEDPENVLTEVGKYFG